MLRLVFIVLTALLSAGIFLLKGLEIKLFPGHYDEDECYAFVRHYCNVLAKKGRITTEVYGTENLPQDGGYVMFPNHQGKYDALGIVIAHEKPCSVMMEKSRSYLLFANEFIILLDGVRHNKNSIRAKLDSIHRVTDAVKSGRRFIIFPEGGYRHNHNEVQEFLPGAFKCAIRAKAPIVPVALIDSYIPFEYNSIKPVRTQVHFLPPLGYDDYKGLSSQEIAEKVKESIVGKIRDVFAHVTPQ